MEFTKIGFYDNSTETWSAWESLQVGHEGVLVYDKTTDSAKVSIYTTYKPSIEVNQWAFVGYFANNTTTILTYDSEGLPLNHEQYTVAKVQKVLDKSGMWHTSIALQEPIESFKGIITETLSFTNQTFKTVTEDGDDNTYKKDPYNCLTALERVLKVTPANNNLANSLYNKITILDSDFLKTIEFNDETFTAGDLFTILFKFDELVDRTPVIYFDMANLGAVKKWLLKFDRKDGFGKTELDFDELIEDNVGYEESDTIDTYASGVVSEIGNLTTGNILQYPNVNLWAVPEYDTEDRTIPTGDTEKGNFFIKMPTAIKRINLIKRLYIAGADREVFPNPRNATIERVNTIINGKYILEKQNYLASELLQDVAEKNKCFWFEEGTNKLYVNEYYSKVFVPELTPPNYNTQIYYIEYEPIVDGAMQYGDNDFCVSVNQGDSQVESFKYSAYLMNYLKGMNKADIIFTKVFDKYADFKDLLGSKVIDGTEEYIISNVAYKNANTQYVVAIQLNRDNLRRNLNVRASEQIRPNKAIDYKNLKDRKSRFIDFIKIDTESGVDTTEYGISKLPFLSALCPSEFEASLTPQVAFFIARGKLLKQSIIDPTVYMEVDFRKDLLLNFAKIINKGQIQFNLKTQDNAQIGTKKVPNDFDGSSGGGTIQYFSILGDVKEQLPIIFTDPFGEVQTIDYRFSYLEAEELEDIETTLDAEEYDRTYKVLHTMANLPIIPDDYKQELLDNTIFEILNINKYKDMLEVLNDNFIFNVTSDNKNIIVCQGLLELSRVMQTTDTHTLKVWGFDRKTSENDLLTDELFELAATSTYDDEEPKFTINFTGQDFEDLKSFVITTDTNKKLLIINNPDLTAVENGAVEIYF